MRAIGSAIGGRLGRARGADARPSVGLILAILALLLQNGVPLQYPTMAASGYGAVGGPSGHHAAADTRDHRPHHGGHGQRDDRGPKNPACSVCQAMQHLGGFLPTPAFDTVATPAFERGAPPPPVSAPARDLAFLVPQSRAPPSAA